MMEQNKTNEPQKYVLYEGCNYVYKSNKLKIVDEKFIEYEDGLNNNSPLTSLVISKYIKLSYLIDAIKNHTFYFASPESWLDPFELLFYKPIIKIADEDLTIHACCFACNDIENEEGFWNIWRNGESEPIVRVTYNLMKLVDSLNGNDMQYKYYLGGIEYTSREQILCEAAIPHTYANVDDYLNKLSLKRNAYKYENELRLYVERENTDERSTVVNRIDYGSGIISEIVLPPIAPLGNSHPSRDMFKCMQDSMNLKIKSEITELVNSNHLNCKVVQSALYCTGIRERVY